jgi:hypothetical protein
MDRNASVTGREGSDPQYRPGPNGEVHGTMLFPDADAERLRNQWNNIQADFVDAPRQAVERADALVADAMKRLTDVFAGERANLEGQWDRGDVSTEDLRVALQRYRAFFDRLLSVSSS